MSAMRQCAGRQVSSRAATMARPTPVGRVHLQVQGQLQPERTVRVHHSRSLA